MSVTRFLGAVLILVSILAALLFGGCAIAILSGMKGVDAQKILIVFITVSPSFGCLLLAYGGWKMMWEKNKKKPPIIEGYENDH